MTDTNSTNPESIKRTSHPLSGANPATLFGVLRDYGPLAPEHRRQFVFAAMSSLAKAPVSMLERLYVALHRKRIEPIEPPIFILGHWRSGTTHLYNVMSKAAHFGYVSPVQTALPWDFLLLGRMLGRFLEKELPEGRYIDNVSVDADSPQEDEIALANMSPLSFYHGLYFPKDFRRIFYESVFFEGVKRKRIKAWLKLQRYLFLKLQLAQDGRRLVIKNPVYTARAQMLQESWPGAKFIHIHRNPYKVFFSMRNFYDKLFKQFALQPWDHIDIDEHIFTTYLRMMARLEKGAAAMAPGQYVELRFDDFQANPMQTLEHIYGALDLPGFEGAEPAFRKYLDTVTDYQKNTYTYPEADIARITERWGSIIDKWGYQPPGAGG